MEALIKKYNSASISKHEILQILTSVLIGRSLVEIFNLHSSAYSKGLVKKSLTRTQIDTILTSLCTSKLISEDYLNDYYISDDLQFYVLHDLHDKNPELLKLIFYKFEKKDQKENHYKSYHSLRYYLTVEDKPMLNSCFSDLIDMYGDSFDFSSIVELISYDDKLSFLNIIDNEYKAFVLDFILAKYIFSVSDKELLFSHLDVNAFEYHQIRELQEYIMFYYVSVGEIDVLDKHKWKAESIGIYKFFKGEYQEAKEIFETCLRDYQKYTKSKKKYLPGLSGFLYTSILLCYENSNPKLAKTFINGGLSYDNYLYVCLEVYHDYKKDPRETFGVNFFIDMLNDSNIYTSTFVFTILSWIDTGLLTKMVDVLSREYTLAKENNAYQTQYILGRLFQKINGADWLANDMNAIKEKAIYSPIENVLHQKETWQEILDILKTNDSSEVKIKRLAWFFDYDNLEFTLFEQTKNKKGVWSKGREVSMKNFKNKMPSSAIAKDLSIAKCVIQYGDSYYSYSYASLNIQKALPFFVDHPHVFLANSKDVEINFESIKPEVIIETKENNYELSIPKLFHNKINDVFILFKESITKYQICILSPKFKRFANMIGDKVIKIPISEKDKLSEIINHLDKISVLDSDFIDENIREVVSDSTCIIQLVPLLEGLSIKILIRPFGDFGPYFVPTKGRLNLSISHDDNKLQCKRKIREEHYNVHQLASKIPSLNGITDFSEDINFNEPEDCLNLITELKLLGDQVKIEWPKGETFKIKDKIDASNLHLNIKKRNTWFDIDGQVELNNKQVIKLKELIERSRNNESRFIKLDDGMFLALSNEFKRQLNELDSFGVEKGDVISIHKLAAHGMQGMIDQAESTELDPAWTKCVNNINKAEKFTCKLPSTLQATLRPYQREGFEWMMRLDNWGVGACLADDMGLGKTLQSIAMLIKKASKGPSIVVAPASVVANWFSEIRKFSPSLQPIILTTNNRGQQISKLKKFDVLLISYGLVYTEIEKLEQIKWSAVVLDEAHAIKNFMSKRTKAVMKLDADFKLLTTGTPIQNNLTELWSLFNFINPGLLFTQKLFNDKFVNTNNDDEFSTKRNKLKNLIKPFILRRTKNQVLNDLPGKTEIILNVEQSPQEKAFYEALRQKAIENIEENKKDDKKGAHILVLAEIMKLRQACCHPDMAIKNSKIESSKLNLFETTIDELILGGHKVLVFSQFVTHLSILRKSLDKKSISYQYLDGSTSMKKREIAVNDFQSGIGDVFLISLKAGGLGLNLTAADYVIHMDPWWNPAIEDQASDRAHRYGQQRPVTIYRMITTNTIEEKMLKLHHEKRELADDLLEGTNKANKLTADDLLKLIM